MEIIIGAGATGLAYAALSGDDSLVIEAAGEAGGYCRTIKQNGFVWDYSGHFFHFRDEWMKNFILARMQREEILECRKRTQIYYKGNYVDFPFQKNIHQLPRKEFIDCLYDLFNNPHHSQSTFKEMLYTRFGEGIADKFLIPYNEKLYACDLESLDPDAMGRFFPYADREEIIANFKIANNVSYNDAFIYPRGGAIEYIKSLQARVSGRTGKTISLNERVLAIDVERREVKTTKRVLPYCHLISTMPFNRLMEACRLPHDASAFSWNKVLVFNLGFNRPSHGSRNNWVYFPGKDFIFYRVGYYDRIFNAERMSLYVELGFPASAPIDVAGALERVMSGLRQAGIVTDQRLTDWSSVIMDPAYVHISAHSAAEVEKQRRLLARYGVYSIGRYGGWTYCSIEDGMLEAKALAETLTRS